MNSTAYPRQSDASATRPEDVPTYDAHDLIPNGSQARVLLDGQCYLLRITRAGKLILTK